MTMRLRCRCGQVQGELAEREVAAHMICYCKDCRAYARYLGMDAMLDEAGGTELCATLPASVTFASSTVGVNVAASPSACASNSLHHSASISLDPVSIGG